MRRRILSPLLAILLGGCSHPRHGPVSPQTVVPAADGMMTQRGMLTVLGRHFTLTGYLATSAGGDLRLVLTETFGGVLADVLAKRDGRVFVIRSSPALRPEWIRKYVAEDARCMFGGQPRADCPVRQLSPTHFVIDRWRYRLDVQIVESKPGPQPPELFDEPNPAAP